MADSKISALPAVTTPASSDEIPVNQGGTTRKATAIQVSALAGRTFFISPAGSDSTGSGTVASPWQTVSKFVSNGPLPGDTLYVRGGDYGALTGNMDNYITGISGSPGRPITVQAYAGETPVFHGNGSAHDFALLSGGSMYWTFDGLTFLDYRPVSSGMFWIGDASVMTGHVTIRNCSITLPTGLSLSNDHAIYASQNSTDVTVEGCVLRAAGSCGAGFHADHDPGTLNFLVKNCLFDGFQNFGVALFATAETGSVLSNTFVNFGTSAPFIDARFHGTLLVRDNAGDSSGLAAARLYDPNNSASTTADHNLWSQAITPSPDYDLVGGDSAVRGASDGWNAGWRPGRSEDVVGSPVVPVRSMRIPDGYLHDVIGRLTLTSSIRMTAQGTGRMVLTDDLKTRSRIVLAGRG